MTKQIDEFLNGADNYDKIQELINTIDTAKLSDINKSKLNELLDKLKNAAWDMITSGRYSDNQQYSELKSLFNDLSNVVYKEDEDDLVQERDKYGANDIKPGLTGWAQINGRDELEITEKARLDGEYKKNLSFSFDLKCFLESFKVFTGDDSVVEGNLTKGGAKEK